MYQWSEYSEFSALGQPGAGEFGALEITGDARVLAVEYVPVPALEIEGEIECATQPSVGKFAAPGVEGESLHDPDVVDRKLFQHHALLSDCRKVVSGRRVLGDVLRASVEIAGFEGPDVHGGVTKVTI